MEFERIADSDGEIDGASLSSARIAREDVADA